MRIELIERGGVASPDLKEYVGLRLMSVLDHVAREIEGITALLDAQPSSAEKGGANVVHRCRLVARFLGGGQIAVERTDTGVYSSIDGAAEILAGRARWSAAGAVRARDADPRIPGGPPQPLPLVNVATPVLGGVRVDVRTRGFVRPDSLRSHAHRRLGFALGRFRARIRSLRVDIDDVNGPKGGVDKRCQMTACLRDRDVRVAVLDDDVYRAIDRAADALRRGVTRHIGRRREWAAERTAKGGVQ